MSRKKNKKVWQSAEMNNLQYRMYYEMLQQMSCSVYRWEGLPPEIDQRFLELTLFNRGLSVFFHDDAEYDAYFATMGARLVPSTCTRIRRSTSPMAQTDSIDI